MTYNDVVVSETSLAKCLEKLFGYKMLENNDLPESVPDLNFYLEKAINNYNDAKKYSQEGNWESFGKAMDELDINMGNIQNILSDVSENNIQ